jgi:hypothetical protein
LASRYVGLKLFVDGIQRAQGTSANGGTRATTAVVPTIGGLSQTIAQMFEGNIDEVSIFDSAISIGDVWDGSGQPTDLNLLATPPINYYRFEEGSGTTAIDSGSGGNNGTLNNGVVYSTNVP